MNKVYTWGYYKQDLNTLTSLIEELYIYKVIDVRIFPTSKLFPNFNAKKLQSLLGKRYLWLRSLGNISRDIKNIEVLALTDG